MILGIINVFNILNVFIENFYHSDIRYIVCYPQHVKYTYAILNINTTAKIEDKNVIISALQIPPCIMHKYIQVKACIEKYDKDCNGNIDPVSFSSYIN